MAKDSLEEPIIEIEAVPLVAAGAAGSMPEPLPIPIEESTAEETLPGERRHIVKSATLVMLGNLGSSVMGMVRQQVVAAFGQSIASPFISAITPAQTFNDFLINGSINGALVPTFNDYAAPEKREELRRLVFTLVNLVFLVMLTATIVFFFIAPWFISNIQVRGYTPQEKLLTTQFARIIFFSLLALGPFAVLQAALDTLMADFGQEIIPSLLGRVRLYAYVFDGYWADLGTVHAFFEANLALTQPHPPFNLFDPRAPIYTHARYLPPSHFTHCTLDQVVSGEGCLVTEAHLRRCVLGSRSRIEADVVLEDVVMLGASGYQTADEIAADRAQGRPPMGIGRQSRLGRAIIDRDARIGEGVVLAPAGHPDGDYPYGLFLREGILCVGRGACIPAGFTL